MDLSTDMRELKGIGDKNGALFHKLNIDSVGDLLFHFPRAYEKYDAPVVLNEAKINEKNAIWAVVVSSPVSQFYNRKSKLIFTLKDDAGCVFRVTYFNMPYLKKSISVGKRYLFYGTLVIKNGEYEMAQPKMFSAEQYASMQENYQPIYSTTKGLTSEAIFKYVKLAYEKCEKKIVDPFPLELIQKRGFVAMADMVYKMHMPSTYDDVIAGKKRLAYNEFFYFLLSVRENQDQTLLKTTKNQYIETAWTKRLAEKLPFELTDSQRLCFEEIERDLCSGTICNRLIQGDVGSGKTIIAILALLQCCANGKQGAFMAPTEVLAVQHYQLLCEMTKDYDLPFKLALLTGSTKTKDKREILEQLAKGEINLLIGTHALIEEPVVFHDLSLVVTDEQHRFGVRQRMALQKKGTDVHTIVMSATPIPRSLAMILYGGLHVSTMKDMPKERLPIKNSVVNTSFRPSAYKFIHDQIRLGHQAYVICPMVEEGIMDELENVEEYTEKLKHIFPPEVRIQKLHGKMKATEKNQIMDEFARHNIDILVSTTVIEVGINVPNATVIMIENAERFGLAALHQLRGRVGRGKDQSYCIFIDSKEDDKSKKRLKILGESNDGFYIANEDLKMRGPGEMTGTLQSGDSGFVFADIYEDADMLYLANEDVTNILVQDPELKSDAYAGIKKAWMDQTKDGYIHTL